MAVYKNKLRILAVAVLVIFASLLLLDFFIVSDPQDIDKDNIVKSNDDVSTDKAASQNNQIDSTLPKPLLKKNSEDTSQLVADLPGPEMDDEYIDAIVKVPVHPWQKERSKNIKSETLEQTIENFANFDDISLAATSISGIAGSITSAAFNNIVVTRLARVRRVMEEGRVNPEKVIPLVQKAFQNAIKQWPQTALERKNAINIASSQGKAFTRTEPDLYDKYRYQSLAATYILAELGNHDSLPFMLKCYELHDYEKGNFAPVAPGTTLYAMHRLISSFPDKQLSSKARNARDNYLQLANEFPAPEEVTVTKSWYSNYDESDPRIQILDTEKKVLLKETSMKMLVYPSVFTDGTATSNWNGESSEKTKLLFGELEKFVEEMYPDLDWLEKIK